jgi:uncharacterized membrane protein
METQIVWVIMLVLIVIGGGFYFLFPRISRRGLLFGVYVGEEVSQGEEARRITRTWYRGMLAWIIASAALAAVAELYFNSLDGSLLAFFLFPIGFFVEYLRAYSRAGRLSTAGAPSAAAAMIASEPSAPPLLPYLAVGLGLIGGVGAILYTWSFFGQLPARIPTHFGLTGTPDAWKPRTFLTVMLTPIMSLIMGVGLGGIALLTGRAKRAIRSGDEGVSFEAQQRFRKAMANYLAILSLLTTGMMTLLSISSVRVAMQRAAALPPVFMILAAAVLIAGLGGGFYIAVKYGQGGSRLERSAANAPLTNGLADNRLWVLGMFYVNRDDPSIFVERRFGLGYTINFGNPKALALVFGFIGIILFVVILAALVK